MTRFFKVLASIRTAPREFSLYLVLILLVLVPYGLRLWLLQTRPFDVDEFEHMHVAWSISKGLVPYRDFFEHHTPWFHFFLAPFYEFFAVDRTTSDAIAFLFFARRIMWILTGIILLLTFWLGKLWRGTLVGLVGVLFLLNTEIFLTSTIEVRPDLFACMFWLACLIMVFYAIRLIDTSGSKIWWRFAWSGVFLGAGIMSNQKVLFVIPGLAVGMALYVLMQVGQGCWRVRFCNSCCFIVGACLPLLITLAYFYFNDGLEEFVFYNLVFNIRFQDRFSPLRHLHQLLFGNPYLAFFGILALVDIVRNMLLGKWTARADLFLVPSTIGVIVGLFIVPVPHAQYYLLFLPLLALFAASGVATVFGTLAESWNEGNIRRWIASALCYVCSAVIFLVLVSIGAGSPHPYLVIAFWSCALAGGIIFVSLRLQVGALMFFIVMVSIPPLKRWTDYFHLRNTDQIRQIEYVIENTTSSDTIMDGFTGTGLFRRHAYYFFCFTTGIQRMLSAKDFDGLFADLKSGNLRPAYIIFDVNLRTLPTPITSFFSEHYKPVGIGDIWRRKEA